MKRFILLIISLILLVFDSSAQISDLSDSCSLTFMDIYNFNVGDVFQYENEIIQGDVGYDHTTVELKKYTIDTKMIIGDSLIYGISGLMLTYFAEAKEYTTNSYTIDDFIILVDSTNHFLNSSYDTIPTCIDEEHFAVVRDTLEESECIKIVGGEGSLFYKGDSLFLPPGFFGFEEKYGLGLGLLTQQYWSFESGGSKRLLGYVKNGDTTGIISPDIDFIVGLENKKLPTSFKIYPNPTDESIRVSISENQDYILEIYDQCGRILLTSSISDSPVDVSGLNAGIYLVILRKEYDIVAFEKLLKK